MLHDLRLAFRQIAKSPGFAAVIVFTLAFGIAVNATIFGIVGTFLFQRLPVADADRIALILQRTQSWNAPHPISFPDFQDYRDRLRSFESLIAYTPLPAHLVGDGDSPQRAWVEVVTPNVHTALGVVAEQGRMLVPADGEAAGSAPVAVLSYRCWTERFGSSPGVVGRMIRLNNRPFTVVGVAPKSFSGLSPFLAVDAFVPTGAIDALRTNGAGMLEWRNAPLWRVLGKLRPGTTVKEAGAEATIVTGQIAAEHPDTHHDVSSSVILEQRGRPDPSVSDMLPVFAALFLCQVALVLGIACANVANLLLARSATRMKEMTVRAALGAGRGRLVRQLLVESILLALIAGALGWFLADWTGPLISRLSQQGDLPVNASTGPLWPQRLFTFAIALIAGIASGLLPALRATRIDLTSQLKEGTGIGIVSSRQRLRDMFVVSQVVFSLVVLVFAGLFTRSLQQARTIDLGYRTENLLLTSFDLSLQGCSQEQATLFARQALERTRALPGVEDATITSGMPLDYAFGLRDIFPEDSRSADERAGVSTGYATIMPGYERTLGLRLVAGRPIDETDTEATRPVAVVNSAFAERCWPGQDPIGRRFQPWRDGPKIEVVGVVATGKYLMIWESPRPYYYIPVAQNTEPGPLTLAVRTKGAPEGLVAAVRTTLASLDPHLPLYNVRTVDEMLANSIFAFLPLRIGAVLAAIQGVIGLGLAVMGLYAVVTFSVNQRGREIGIRMALGAGTGSIVREVVRAGLKLTLVGTMVGLGISLGLGFALSHLLVGMPPLDPYTLAASTLVLITVSWVACWLPARRATRIDPAVVLRAQ